MKLTHEEIEMLEGLKECEYEYIARDCDGSLYAYDSRKIEKSSGCWVINDYCVQYKSIDEELLKFIKWEDEQPYSIYKLLKYAITLPIMLDEGALCPVRAHDIDAGLDLLSPIDITVPARGSAYIDTGVHVQLELGTAGFLKSKSGLNVKHGITSEGVIDVGYTGSIRVKLYNHSDEDYNVQRGDKITQLVIVKIDTPQPVIVDKFEETERGDNGFGSTGR